MKQAAVKKLVASKPLPPARLLLRLVAALLLGLAQPVLAQTTEQNETAKRFDTVSPTGVSYPSGSFTYNIDLLSIGAGDYPARLTFGLRYDSASASDSKTTGVWTQNVTLRMSRTVFDDGTGAHPTQPDTPYPPFFEVGRNVVAGQRVASFYNFSFNPAENPHYHSIISGDTLDYEGNTYDGEYTYTSGDGSTLTFELHDDLADNPVMTFPDGTTIIRGCPTGIYCLYSNRGVAIVAEDPVASGGNFTQEICVVNLAEHALATLAACPSGVPTITLTFDAVTMLHGSYGEIYSVAMADGTTETYTYSTSTDRLLTCIKSDGQSQCRVTNSYVGCDVDGISGGFTRHRVTQQAFQTGETITYSYVPSSLTVCGEYNSKVTMTQNGETTIVDIDGSQVQKVTDPLSREWSFTHVGLNPDAAVWYSDYPYIGTETSPEGELVEYTYDFDPADFTRDPDARGNLLETRRNAKPGSGLADIVTSSTFPATCTNRITCNKPTSTTDANGNVTDYEYDATHGGVTKVTAPADSNGVRPQTRYAYAQRYAWVKASGSGYEQAASPVWVLTSEEYCRTSSATGGGSCSAGASDEVVTTYDYGPDSGPNNLWLRGKAVTSDGVTLRTCYSYDGYGRMISETAPNANLSSCP